MENTSVPVNTPVTPATNKKSNNVLVIVVVVLLVLGLLGLLAVKIVFSSVSRVVNNKAGETIAEKMIEKATGGKADVDINGNEVSVKTKEGTFTTGNKLPDDWPSDVPVYPGSTVTYSGSSNPQTGQSGVAAVFTSKDGGDKVVAYYKRELVSQGWTIDATQESGGYTIMSATKESRNLALTIVESDGTTTISIGLSQEN